MADASDIEYFALLGSQLRFRRSIHEAYPATPKSAKVNFHSWAKLRVFRTFGDTPTLERKRLNWTALVDSGRLDASQYAVARYRRSYSGIDSVRWQHDHAAFARCTHSGDMSALFLLVQANSQPL